ncbi:FAD-dependent oxidoreductase [Gammaproteobacteria bacterium]|nr:FAD-dependent oxidoreductase [Gammaproteobacteria bacterium]
MNRSVLIVGAGIVGAAAALQLRRAGLEVTLIESNAPGCGASMGNGGVLASCAIVPVTTPSLPRQIPRYLLKRDSPLFLRWSYLPRMLPWLSDYLANVSDATTRRIADGVYALTRDALFEHQTLAGSSAAATHIRPSPYVFAYSSRQAFDQDAYAWTIRDQHGFRPQIIEGPAVKKFDPAYGEAIGLLAVLDHHGMIDEPGQYTAKLVQMAIESGVHWSRQAARELIIENGRLVGVRCESSELRADSVLIAAGAWSKPLAEQAGIRIPLESERGYHRVFRNPGVMPRCPTMIASGKFVATPMASGLRCAGIVEFGGLDAGPSAAPLALLGRQAPAAFKGLNTHDFNDWLGHRPATPDSLPLLGAVRRLPGLFLAFGHQHIGLTAGARSGRLIAKVMTGEVPDVDLTPYDPQRFTP